jgi:hypothetical protein
MNKVKINVRDSEGNLVKSFHSVNQASDFVTTNKENGYKAYVVESGIERLIS